MNSSSAHSLLVSDFDGTMTRVDFYQLLQKHLLPADALDYWQEYRSGRMTHFQALQAMFAQIRVSRERILEIVDQMQIDPQLGQQVSALRAAGWDVVVTSAGCDWYIRYLLAGQQAEVQVYANPGTFEEERGLLMTMPDDPRFRSDTIGVDKEGVVRDALTRFEQVAFAGDGYPDIDAARLVPAARRFARSDLATALDEAGLPYRRFEVWSEIAEALVMTND